MVTRLNLCENSLRSDPARGHKVYRKTSSGRKTYNVLSIQKGNGINEWYICGEHDGTTMVVPERYPRNICMLGRFPVVLWDCSPQRAHI